jgi:hypothetical protein
MAEDFSGKLQIAYRTCKRHGEEKEAALAVVKAAHLVALREQQELHA